MEDFIELKTTEGQTVFIRRGAIQAMEIAPASTRVEGHIKVFVGGVKFLVQIEKEELFKHLASEGKL